MRLMKPTPSRLCALLVLLAPACEPGKGGDDGEGAEEDDADGGDRDLNPRFPSGSDGLDLSDLRPEPAGVDACYLGPDGLGDACLPTVAWSSDWGTAYAYPEPLDAQYPRPLRYLDLDALPPDTALAPNFQLDELAQAHKGRFGVVQAHAVERLQGVRDLLGTALYVNSGYRNVDWNAGVGGATWSRHMWGDAFDLDDTGVTLDEIAAACADEGASYISEYAGHVHCDWRDDPLDPAFFDPRAGGPPAEDARMVAQGGELTAPATGFPEGEPRRQWKALGPDGRVLARAEGPRFRPPAGATAVTVRVGGRLERRLDLAGAQGQP